MTNDYDWEANIGQIRTAEAVEKEPDEFFDLINPSQREHLQKPEGFSNDKSLYTKSWDELTPEEQKNTEQHMKQRYEKVEGVVDLEEIKAWRESIDSILFHHFLDPDDWWIPESWVLANKKWDDYTQEELNEIIGTFSFRHGGVDVKHLLKGKGIFYKRAPSANHFKLVDYKKDMIGIDNEKAQELKARLAAVGIKFPEEPKAPKTLDDVKSEHRLKQRKYLNTPQTKPKQEEFSKIISAAREHVLEAKADFDHKHSIEWRQVTKGTQRTAFLIDDYPHRRFTKYWLLNAKQVNGNGWGVDPSTIDINIQKFVGKPFVVTAQSWIPDSEYGNSYVHPYVPTNNLKKIFQHQAKYTVGIVRRIIKDDKDDYYAMIEKLPKFAHMRDPPFCSPGIFQMDRNEPMDKIRTWEPLHLAGLEEDPAYGAHVALLKGNCVGTENECYVQFRGAKMEMITQCPIRNAKKNKLKSRLAELRLNDEGITHIKAKEVIDALAKGGELSEPQSGSFITPDGKLLPPYGTNHYDTVRELGPKLGMKFTDKGENRPRVDDEDIHTFLQKTGMVRVQHFPREQSTSVHIASPLTSAQRTRIKNFTEDDPNMRLGYFVGPDYNKGVVGESFRNLMVDHAKQFSPRLANQAYPFECDKCGRAFKTDREFSEHIRIMGKEPNDAHMAQGSEDEDTNYNMTYMKSKPTKVKKKKFAQSYTKIQNARLRQLFAAENSIDNDISNFKQQKNLDYKKGFTFDPRSNKTMDSGELRKSYGKPGTKMHMIARTDNAEGVDKIKSHLEGIKKEGQPHFIGGYTGEDGKPKTDAVYALHSNDDKEVQEHLKKHNQESAYTIDEQGKGTLTKRSQEKTGQLQAQQEDDEPLQIQYNGEPIYENGIINLGSILGSNREDEDWHEYSINLINISNHELRGMRVETNMGDELMTFTIPEALGAKQSCPATLKIRASKVLKAEIVEKPYLIMKYREVRHY